MTKLDKLILELCQNGIEYKKLGDIATISRGGSFQKKDYVEKGVPCIHYGQIYMHYGLFVDKTISYPRLKNKPALSPSSTALTPFATTSPAACPPRSKPAKSSMNIIGTSY